MFILYLSISYSAKRLVYILGITYSIASLAQVESESKRVMEPQNSTAPQDDNQSPGDAPSEPAASTEPSTEAPTTPEPSEGIVPEATVPDSPVAPEPPVAESPEPTVATVDPAPAAEMPEPASADTTPQTEVTAPAYEASPEPVASGAIVGGADQSPTVAGSGPVKRGNDGRQRFFLIGGFTLILLLIVGYVLAFYLPNRPSEVYATSLKNTGDALNTLINYTGNVANKNYKSYDVNSTLHVVSTASFDASLSGAVDTSGNSKFKVNTDVLGEKVNGANLESCQCWQVLLTCMCN